MTVQGPKQLDIDWTGFFDDEPGDKFRQFHADNPHVLETIIRRARILNSRDQRASMKLMFELLRWDHLMTTETDEPFKLNNNYTSYYTRLVEAEAPDLIGFFAKRRAKSDA